MTRGSLAVIRGSLTVTRGLLTWLRRGCITAMLVALAIAPGPVSAAR